MPAFAGQLLLSESQEDMKPITLNSDSDNDAAMSFPLGTARKAPRRSPRVQQTGNGNEIDCQKATMSNTTPKAGPKKTITSGNKRAASEEYPTPPPTEKKIKLVFRPASKDHPETFDVEDTDSKKKRWNKPMRIMVPKRQAMATSTMADHKTLWEEKHFDLQSPLLDRSAPLKYTTIEVKSPRTGETQDQVCVPDSPLDNIRKVLFLHPLHTGIKWVGAHAERKLAAEKAKYERVKEFWLFGYGHAYCPNWDQRHQFVAETFHEELQSPWVLAWLAQLIGPDNVYQILDHLEQKMTKALEDFEDDTEEDEDADVEGMEKVDG